MKIQTFKKFLADNTLITLDQHESVGSLYKEVQQNKGAKICIEKDHSWRIFGQQKKFSDMIKNLDPEMKLKKFLKLHEDQLKNFMKIEKDSGLHTVLKDYLSGYNSEKAASYTGGYRQIRTDDDYFETESADDAAGPEGYTGTRWGGNYGSSGMPNYGSSGGHYASRNPGSGERLGTSPGPAAPKPYYVVTEFADTAKPDSNFQIHVFLSRERAKKSSDALKLEEGWQLDILITATKGLIPDGAILQSVTVAPENINKKLPFNFKTAATGEAGFIILVLHLGNVLYRNEYSVTISGDEQEQGNQQKKRSRLQGKPNNTPADLTLIIQQTSDRDGKVVLNYVLFSPEKKFNLNYKEFESPAFQKDVADYFLKFFNDIDKLQQQNKQKKATAVEIMKSRCATLYRNLFPAELRTILWSIHDQIKTVIINSQEPWIPWEICFAYSEDEGIDTGFFLCEAFEMARWIPGKISAPGELDLTKAAFVIPEDSGLTYPPDEKTKIEEIVESVGGSSTEIEASYLEVKKNLNKGEYSLWHFSGHGTDSNDTNPAKYKIILDNEDSLCPEDITGMPKMGKSKPIIFFNACQAGKPGMSLTGLSGWPEALISNQIGAFVGAYWSVKDSVGYQLSTKFYERLAAGDTIAKALKTARLHARDSGGEGDPSWLAYSLYADPFAIAN